MDRLLCCTAVMAHENKHEEDFRQVVWGGEPFDPNKDQDRNYLKDSWELENLDTAMCPNAESRYKICYLEWAEKRAIEVEENYPDNSSTNDWSSPGSNFK